MALSAIAVIPFGGEVEILGQRTWLQLTDLNIGLLFLLALSSMGVYGVALAGWASNNKYALLGGLRAAAQMVSYELPLSLALAAPLLLVNTLSLREIVLQQSGFAFGFLPNWTIFLGPIPQIVSFVLFLIAGFAETNRIPFDLPEAENELVAGFHTEYSSMKFASFFMAEYANMINIAAITTTVFLGGWTPPFPAPWSNFLPGAIFALAGLIAIYHGLQPARRWDKYTLPVAGLIFFGLAALLLFPLFWQVTMPLFWFCAKTGFLLFVFIWVRGTLPRFRYDQLMGFAWKFMFPAALINLLVTGLLVALYS
jgi:NADH-quinone oxidoreductase subunit H